MEFKEIFIHCSDSDYGSALLIDQWHRARGWTGGIGYHFVVSNGRTTDGMKNPWNIMNGSIEAGRRLDDDDKFEADEVGAQVYGLNSTSIGICMIGKKSFSESQFLKLRFLVGELQSKLKIPAASVYGHYEAGIVDPKYATTKTCPNFNVSDFRLFVADKITMSDMMSRTKIHIAGLNLAP